MSFPPLSRMYLSVGTRATTAVVLTRPTFATVDRSDIVDYERRTGRTNRSGESRTAGLVA
jgi:hypothetical protein